MSKPIAIPQQINQDLAYLLGVIRDGGIHYDKKNKAYKIHFSQKNRKFLETEINSRLRKLFDITGKISKRKDGVYQLQFASKPIYLFFSEVFDMKEIQQYWDTPKQLVDTSKMLKKEYLLGFYDAEGSKDHIYHSWYREGECPPLEVLSDILNNEFKVRTTKPMRIKTDDEFNRYPAYQIFINDYLKFKKDIIGIR